jgi:hypothetical protein
MLVGVFFTTLLVCCHCAVQSSASPKVWVSISVCLDTNTDFDGGRKSHFPYQLATMYASYLWREITGYRVLVGLVTDSPHNASHIADSLTDLGVDSYIVRSWSGYSCAETSQLVRMFAYRHHVIKPYEIIVTADADALVSSPLFMTPLEDRHKIVWLWQHGYAENYNSTYPMSFIGARSAQWRSLLDPFGELETHKIMSRWEAALKMSTADSLTRWGFDQLIITQALLETNLCPTTNPTVYSLVKLPMETGRDRNLCFKGNYLHTGGTWGHYLSNTTEALLKEEFIKILVRNNLAYDNYASMFTV